MVRLCLSNKVRGLNEEREGICSIFYVFKISSTIKKAGISKEWAVQRKSKYALLAVSDLCSVVPAAYDSIHCNQRPCFTFLLFSQVWEGMKHHCFILSWVQFSARADLSRIIMALTKKHQNMHVCLFCKRN